MGFREHLQDVVARVDGALACTLMAVDGIEVETHTSEAGGLDVRNLLVEYSSLFRLAREAAETHQAGDLKELSILTGGVLTVARLVTPEYLLAVALKPDGNFGKARYMLRVTAPKLEAEL
jgi:predicted regulator of Ras-like GTPase activity (Roadblock/LC7/MglB family)